MSSRSTSPARRSCRSEPGTRSRHGNTAVRGEGTPCPECYCVDAPDAHRAGAPPPAQTFRPGHSPGERLSGFQNAEPESLVRQCAHSIPLHEGHSLVSDTTTDLVDARPEPGTAPDSTHGSAPAESRPRRKAAGLNGMVLAELQAVAGSLGIGGTAKMRKGQLIEAINAAQAPSGTWRPAGRFGQRRWHRPRRGTGRVRAERPEQNSTTERTRHHERPAAQGGDGATAAAPPPSRAQSRAAEHEPRQSRSPTAAHRRTATHRPTAMHRPTEPASSVSARRASSASRVRGASSASRASSAGPARAARQFGPARQAAGQSGAGQSDGGTLVGRPEQPGQRPVRPEPAVARTRVARTAPTTTRTSNSPAGRRRRRGRNRERRPGVRERNDRFGGAGEPDLGHQRRRRPGARRPASSTSSTTTRFVRTSGYLPGPGRRLRDSLPRSARYGLRKGDAVTGASPAAEGGRAQGEVQRAGPPRHRQRRRPGERRRTASSSTS